MLRRIGCDHPKFKELHFKEGMNLLLSDKTKGASNRQTRNGSGKSSLLEIIHFLFGSNIEKKSIFKCADLIDLTFSMDLVLESTLLTASRSPKSATRISIEESNSVTIGAEREELSNGEWKAKLGDVLFGLKLRRSDEKFTPGFRSLFSYFVRRESDGGFQSFSKYFAKQKRWDEQVSLSYLLKLDWSIQRDFEMLRTKEANNKTLLKASRSSDLFLSLGKPSDLRTKIVVLESKLNIAKEHLAVFKVLPKYQELEIEAADLTININSLNNQNISDRELLQNLQTAISNEQEPENKSIEGIYTEVGIILPNLISKRFDEVESFHRSIISNRKKHLAGEIQDARTRIQAREEKKVKLDERRQEIMSILSSGGALEHYAKLQEEVGRLDSQVAALKNQLQMIDKLEESKASIKIERNQLFQSLKTDILERSEIVSEAILIFESLSEQLYIHERAGSLTISETLLGIQFDVKIDSKRSSGINNMQIFCFDMMLMELIIQNGLNHRILVHDSHLFDGVDERQVARALQIGAERSKRLGFQYIVTLNTDALPTEGFNPDFSVEEFILPVKLTDATDDGGLFGFRFN
jgi:uncharacterized protein YydD (DUF2326 family)